MSKLETVSQFWWFVQTIMMVMLYRLTSAIIFLSVDKKHKNDLSQFFFFVKQILHILTLLLAAMSYFNAFLFTFHTIIDGALSDGVYTWV